MLEKWRDSKKWYNLQVDQASVDNIIGDAYVSEYLTEM